LILLTQVFNGLISIKDGALISKGEYLIFPDPDDILTQDILNTCYQVQK